MQSDTPDDDDDDDDDDDNDDDDNDEDEEEDDDDDEGGCDGDGDGDGAKTRCTSLGSSDQIWRYIWSSISVMKLLTRHPARDQPPDISAWRVSNSGINISPFWCAPSTIRQIQLPTMSSTKAGMTSRRP